MKHTLRREQPAQTLIEFALLLPLLLLIVFFILDFGRAVYYYSALFNGAREGARYGTTVVYIDETGLSAADLVNITTAAKKHLHGLPADEVTVTASITGTLSPPVKYIHVTTRYIYTPVTPLVSLIVPSITLESTSRMRIELRIDM